MENTILKGKACTFAIPKPDGNPFWQNAFFEGENDTHYFFKVKGQLVAVLRIDVKKIEFQDTSLCGSCGGV